ncbi:MAG: hypothetical protein GY871_03170, partial [Actinomycetales bacterium]|nr:hypothetical protein [Actinomycetales bacterium]
IDRGAIGDLNGDGAITGVDVALFLETVGGDVHVDSEPAPESPESSESSEGGMRR